jgi:catechol 2,3-dioxygenase-like lactoylglutathione lyase family enzyme
MSDDERATGIAFNHVGVCVTDLDRSRRFYEEALGFRFWWQFGPNDDDATSTLLRVPKPVDLLATYLLRDGLVLELLRYGSSPAPPDRHRVMDEPGLTHLSLAVRDLPATMARVAECGGEILEDTDVGQAVMIRDPDGQLIELTSWRWRSALPPVP